MFNAFSGVIRGRVQGVGFRYYAKAKARELDLTGWVRNLPDGAVEVMAKGPVSALERFMHCLEEGPIGGSVEKADFQWFQESQELNGFEIRG